MMFTGEAYKCTKREQTVGLVGVTLEGSAGVIGIQSVNVPGLPNDLPFMEGKSYRLFAMPTEYVPGQGFDKELGAAEVQYFKTCIEAAGG